MDFAFRRIERMPPYVFAIVNDLKMKARRRGDDIIDLGMGNPDQGTPKHIVEKMVEAARNPKNHRYSISRGIPKLRSAITDWYKEKYDVVLDPETEAIATIGSKEGISHLALTLIGPGDSVLVPNPTYPIHAYCVIIANGDLRHVPMTLEGDFFEELSDAYKQTWPRPKVMILNFPHNPTTRCVELEFFEKVVNFARENKVIVLHDLAYAELVFDGYKAPSFLQVPGAREVGVEFTSLSKSYNMPGWRIGFVAGNKEIIAALSKMKSYLDYGMFQPLQIAGIIALKGPQDCVREIVEMYRSRRNTLCDGLNRIGWEIEKPRATMFVWARIPEKYRSMGSLEFSKLALEKTKVAVSPGIGFGEYGDEYVRFALVENEHRTRQAVKGLRLLF
jgi:alanine-synthesizing transaminase